MQHTLYAIENTVAPGIYIGITRRSLLRRRQVHLNRLRSGTHHNPHLQAAWNKYGEAAFEFRAVALLDSDAALRAAEIETIADLRAAGANVYNLTDGGDGRNGDTIPPAQRAKISASLRRHYADPANRQKLSEQQRRSYQESPTRREDQAERIRAIQADPAFKRRKSAQMRHRWSRPEERERQSERMQALFQDDGVRERHRQALLDRYTDPDFHARWRDSIKAAWQHPEAIEHKRQGNLRRYEDLAERQKTSAQLRRRYEDPAEREKTRIANERRFNRIYTVTAPDGRVFETPNLYRFCHNHGLSPGRMGAVARGEQRAHQGWTVMVRPGTNTEQDDEPFDNS